MPLMRLRDTFRAWDWICIDTVFLYTCLYMYIVLVMYLIILSGGFPVIRIVYGIEYFSLRLTGQL